VITVIVEQEAVRVSGQPFFIEREGAEGEDIFYNEYARGEKETKDFSQRREDAEDAKFLYDSSLLIKIYYFYYKS